jgi:hypothetical protein
MTCARYSPDNSVLDNRIYRKPQPERERLTDRVVTLEESIEKRRSFIRDADDFVRCLAIELEIELGFRLAIIPVGKLFEFAPPQYPLRKSGAFDGDANAGRFTGASVFLRDCLGGSNRTTRDQASPPSFSLAKTNTVSPLAICLSPYIVFCAVNTKVFARRSRTSILIANAIIS